MRFALNTWVLRVQRLTAIASATTLLGMAAVLGLSCFAGGGCLPKDENSSNKGGGGPSTQDASFVADGAATSDAGPLANGDAAPPSKVDITREIVDVLGGPREFILAMPKSYDAGRLYPLIVALHGDGFSGDTFREYFTVDAVSGDDAIVAYPSGNSWDLTTPFEQNPDQQLVEVVISTLKQRYSIDPLKIWAMGHSKGGFLANTLACRRPGLLSAMAVHASGAPQEPQGPDGFPQCPGVVGLPVMATEGELDPMIGADYSARYWAHVNGCSETRSPATPDACVKHDNCPAGKPVVFCDVPGVKHFPIWRDAVSVSWAFLTAL